MTCPTIRLRRKSTCRWTVGCSFRRFPFVLRQFAPPLAGPLPDNAGAVRETIARSPGGWGGTGHLQFSFTHQGQRQRPPRSHSHGYGAGFGNGVVPGLSGIDCNPHRVSVDH